MSALPIETQPYDGQRLDDALGDNFTAETVADGLMVDCSGCGPFWVPDVEAAIACIEQHRARHNREQREVWV